MPIQKARSLLARPLQRWWQLVRPHRLPLRSRLTRAAVALLIRDTDAVGPELLFIERASRQGDPWSGHMAFPGGKMQTGDAGARYAAMRETREELGIDLARLADYSARLPDLLTRRHSQPLPMVVSPYLFHLRKGGQLTCTPNHEVADWHWVPLAWLRDPGHRTTMLWRTRRMSLEMPCCYWRQRCIWGLSLTMVEHLLHNRVQIYPRAVHSMAGL